MHAKLKIQNYHLLMFEYVLQQQHSSHFGNCSLQQENCIMELRNGRQLWFCVASYLHLCNCKQNHPLCNYFTASTQSISQMIKMIRLSVSHDLYLSVFFMSIRYL